MPITLSRGDRRLLLSTAVVLLVLTLAGALVASGPGDERPTTYSAASGGAKALYLLLQASGYNVDRWQQSVQELPRDGSTTIVIAEPEEAPGPADRLAIEHFLDAGGRVIVTGDAGALLLNAHIKRDPVGGLTWTRVPAVTPSAITRAAPSISIATLASWNQVQFGIPLYGTDETYVVRIPHGRGEAIWWAASTPMSNAGLREAGNLEFVLACLGAPDRGRVLFDEYVHGHRHTIAASIWRSPAKWALAQGALVAVVLLLTHSRRSGPIIVAGTETRLSPLEFVRTLGSLYARAGAAAVPLDAALQRFRAGLRRRFGISASASIEDVERMIRSRAPGEADKISETLRGCDAARRAETLKPASALSLVQSLGEIERRLKLRPVGRPKGLPHDRRQDD